MFAPRCVFAAANRLGEGPIWSEAEQSLYWVDIEQPRILRLCTKTAQVEQFTMPERIGCIALRNRGGLVAGMQSGFYLVDLESGDRTALVDPEPEQADNRINDGKCDGRGRLWAGTMHVAQTSRSGALYRLDADGTVHTMDTGYGITNGPAWSPDGAVLYHNDSAQRTVFAFDFDPDSGSIHNKRVFVQLSAADGFPDGLTVDCEGSVWLAHWGGSRVTRFTADGQVDRVVALPVTQVTSCTLGGPDLRTLYITSARIGLHANELAQQPMAGHLFAIDVEVAGMPANLFAG